MTKAIRSEPAGTERGGPPRRPPWIRVRMKSTPQVQELRQLMRRHRLHTVCEEAACPNLGECWARRHATVMILGSVCTRACAFCNVATGRPPLVDPREPDRLAQAVRELALRHVVVTSVDRDDLPDGGARHFVRCVERLREWAPGTTVELLTPDFRRKAEAVETVADARPEVFGHNLETVPRLYRSIRPGASYRHSLKVLDRAKRRVPALFTKSGMMLGLGEEPDEVLAVMDALREVEVDALTLGQYLRPTPRHAPVVRYAAPEEFRAYADAAREKGFALVAASPLTRSSYAADGDFQRLRDARRGASKPTASAARPFCS